MFPMKKYISRSAIMLVLFSLAACRQGSTEKETNQEAAEAVAPARVNLAMVNEQMRNAALDGDIPGIDNALKAGADVNSPDAEGRTALMFAGFNGHSEIVLKLLDAGAGIDRRDIMGRTALLYTATGPFPETVRILLDRGANPNVVDSDEHFSPLMHASAEGNLDVVKLLVEAGANSALTDIDGDDALSFARQAGHVDVMTYLGAR